MYRKIIFNTKVITILIFLILIYPALAKFEPDAASPNNRKLNTSVTPIKATPARGEIFMKPVMNPVRTIPMPCGTDVQVTKNIGIDQNPAITSDDGNNVLTIYELELYEDELDIGISYSTSTADAWKEPHYFEVLGKPDQPRLDFYDDLTAYGTWTADPWEALGVAYYSLYTDITNPEAGENGWVSYSVEWGTHDIGVPFTSSDVACYAADIPPTESFWGVVGLTGDNEYPGSEEDNTLMVQYNTNESYLSIFWFLDMEYDLFNISVDIDKTNRQLYLAADYVSEEDSSNTGTFVLTHNIGTDEDWMEGSWPGGLLFNCLHPRVEAIDGRVYLTAELKSLDDTTDIICWTTTDPENIESWEPYLVTNTSSENERNPTITALNDKEAIILFTKNQDAYISITEDSGQTWNVSQKVNDQTGTVIEQYGCLDITTNYLVWTDNREGNNDIYFDTAGLEAPLIQISSISGGFGIKATIDNIGTGEAINVPWSTVIDGIVLFGEKNGTIPTIIPGESITIKSGISIGAGPVLITVTASGATKVIGGLMIGPLILIIE